MRFFLSLLFYLLCLQVFSQNYNNPIIEKSLPDPSVIKAKDGFFYLYATEDTRNLPIWRSRDLVQWEFLGTAFNKKSHPNFINNGMIWAPDINYINGIYVLYYSLAQIGNYNNRGIGVAFSEKPSGPFRDIGKLFTSKEIGVEGSIDQFYIEDNGKKYLFWGAFRGIFGIELEDNGLSVKKNVNKIKIAGTFMEATAIEKRNGYYYLFGSAGACCKGANSNYHIVYGRSKNLFGPYVDKNGNSLIDNCYEVLLVGNNRIAGPGHQSRLIQDDRGQDWLIYHGHLKDNLKAGRVVFMDKLEWVDGWPVVKNSEPSYVGECPFFIK